VRPDAPKDPITYYRHRRSEPARILANAQHRMDQLGESALPFDLKIEAMFDVLLQVARDLDRLARRDKLIALSVRRGSVSS
jgi:hypothetical protein